MNVRTLWLILVTAVLVVGQPHVHAQEVSRKKQEKALRTIKKLMVRINDQIERKEIDKVRKLMTADAYNRWAADMLTFGIQFANADMNDDGPFLAGTESELVEPASTEEADDVEMPKPEELAKVLKQYKLDGLKFNDSEIMTQAEYMKRSAEFGARAWRTVKAEDRPRIIRELVAANLGMLAFDGDIREANIGKKQASLTLVPSMDMGGFEAPQGAELEVVAPPYVLSFEKTPNGWIYGGTDMAKTLAELEKFEEEFGGFDLATDEDLDFTRTIENPKFTGKELDGKSVSLSDYRGKVILVDFWGTWCGPCVAELPKLQQLREVFGGHGFDIVGIANDPPDALKEFFSNRKLPWKNIVDADGKIADEYGVRAFPTTLLIDKEGKHIASNLHGKELAKRILRELAVDDATAEKIMASLSRQEKNKKSPKGV